MGTKQLNACKLLSAHILIPSFLFFFGSRTQNIRVTLYLFYVHLKFLSFTLFKIPVTVLYVCVCTRAYFSELLHRGCPRGCLCPLTACRFFQQSARSTVAHLIDIRPPLHTPHSTPPHPRFQVRPGPHGNVVLVLGSLGLEKGEEWCRTEGTS